LNNATRWPVHGRTSGMRCVITRAELAWMPLFASLRSGHATRDRTVVKKGRCIRTGPNVCSCELTQVALTDRKVAIRIPAARPATSLSRDALLFGQRNLRFSKGAVWNNQTLAVA